MKYQDQAIHLTKQAIEGLFRTARSVPQDKVEWQPLDNGRTVLDQLQECAQVPKFYQAILEQRKFPDVDESFFEESKALRQQWKTIDECEKHCQENSEQLFAAIRNFPDDELNTKVMLPFGGGMERALADIIMAHCSNLQYHIGQINYIQTLYGDLETH